MGSSVADHASPCNGHTFEHIYDYDIKLETTKIKHAFDKVWYWISTRLERYKNVSHV